MKTKTELKDIAEWLGISNGFLTNILKRRRFPSRDTLRRLKRITGISYEEWLELDGQLLKEDLVRAYDHRRRTNGKG